MLQNVPQEAEGKVSSPCGSFTTTAVNTHSQHTAELEGPAEATENRLRSTSLATNLLLPQSSLETLLTPPPGMLGQVAFRFIPFQLVEILEQSMKQKDRMRFLQCPLGFHHLSPSVFGDRSSELGSGQVPRTCTAHAHRAQGLGGEYADGLRDRAVRHTDGSHSPSAPEKSWEIRNKPLETLRKDCAGQRLGLSGSEVPNAASQEPCPQALSSPLLP